MNFVCRKVLLDLITPPLSFTMARRSLLYQTIDAWEERLHVEQQWWVPPDDMLNRGGEWLFRLPHGFGVVLTSSQTIVGWNHISWMEFSNNYKRLRFVTIVSSKGLLLSLPCSSEALILSQPRSKYQSIRSQINPKIFLCSCDSNDLVLHGLLITWILVQVLCYVVPSLVKLRKEGLDGHEKIKSYMCV